MSNPVKILFFIFLLFLTIPVSGFHSVDIPYRLDSIEAINAAKLEDLFDLGKGYNLMLMAARKVHLHYPQAFCKAKKSVKKVFTVINEEKIHKTDIRYEEISDLDLASNLERIEAKIPWLKDIARHESAFQYIETFPSDVRKALGVERTPLTPTPNAGNASFPATTDQEGDPSLRQDGPDEIGGSGLS